MRVEKGTPNFNMARTLTAGAFAALLILMAADPLQRMYDQRLLPQPWVHPVIEVRATGQGKPDIFYGAEADINADGRWTAWMEIGNTRCCTNSGNGRYSETARPRLWHWADFFGRDWPVPTEPFRVCVSYTLETTRSGARAQFGPFCSPDFDPAKEAKP